MLEKRDQRTLKHGDELVVGKTRLRFLRARKCAFPYRCVVRRKGEKAREFRFENSRFVIGRAPSVSDLILNNSFVSSAHAEISLRNGEFFLRDMESTNGVCFNGQKLEDKQISIRSEDTFQICDYFVTFYCDVCPEGVDAMSPTLYSQTVALPSARTSEIRYSALSLLAFLIAIMAIFG